VLDELGIRDWFDTIICCNEELGWKPDPAPIHHARQQIGVPDDGHDGVYAGDGASDVGAAWNAGLDAIHIERHGHDRRQHCVLGDYRVTDFEELLEMPTSE